MSPRRASAAPVRLSSCSRARASQAVLDDAGRHAVFQRLNELPDLCLNPAQFTLTGCHAGAAIRRRFTSRVNSWQNSSNRSRRSSFSCSACRTLASISSRRIVRSFVQIPYRKRQNKTGDFAT
jgi:hypothetical protein